MKNSFRLLVAFAVLLQLTSPIRSAAQPVTIAAGTSGNPFTPPATVTRSFFDSQALSGVSRQLEKFLAQNDDLPGSVKPAKLGFDAAMAKLKAGIVVGKNSSFIAAARKEPKMQSAQALQGAAVVFFSQGQGAQALTCLFLAVEKSPKDPLALLNLASAALVYRQANEAIALLDEAGRLGPLPAGAGGLSGASTADYLRGYALMLQGQYAEAKKLLESVVEREPFLREAALTLALVEAKLGEKPRPAFLLGVWRMRPALVRGDDLPPSKPDESPPGALDAGETVGPDLSAVFDLSRGVPGSLPPIDLPRNTDELNACWSSFLQAASRANQESIRLETTIVGAELRAFAAARNTMQPAYFSRMEHLYNLATMRRGVLQALDQAAAAADFSGKDLAARARAWDDQTSDALHAIEDRYGKFLYQKRTTAQQKADREGLRQEEDACTQEALNRWVPLAQQYVHLLDAEYHFRSSFMTGMMSHIGEPHLRRALEAETEAVRQQYISTQFHLLAAQLDHSFMPRNAGPRPVTGGEPGQGGSCSDEDANWSYSFDLEVIEMELSCSTVSFEVKTARLPFMSLSSEISFNNRGEATIFVGPKLEPKINLLGLHDVAGGGSFKTGLYVTADSSGMRDAGGRVEVKTSASAGPVSVNHQEAQVSVSVLPAPSAPSLGTLPTFRGSVP